jgi:hypothetical protein
MLDGDWSSDVCSSDLPPPPPSDFGGSGGPPPADPTPPPRIINETTVINEAPIGGIAVPGGGTTDLYGALVPAMIVSSAVNRAVTSGTSYSRSSGPPVDPEKIVAKLPPLENRWMPILKTVGIYAGVAAVGAALWYGPGYLPQDIWNQPAGQVFDRMLGGIKTGANNTAASAVAYVTGTPVAEQKPAPGPGIVFQDGLKCDQVIGGEQHFKNSGITKLIAGQNMFLRVVKPESTVIAEIKEKQELLSIHASKFGAAWSVIKTKLKSPWAMQNNGKEFCVLVESSRIEVRPQKPDANGAKVGIVTLKDSVAPATATAAPTRPAGTGAPTPQKPAPAPKG